ncbi:MAG: heme ABC transporter permease, partial [Gammaproteobacteria bacterium]|nr:heme ABC transporter permease [Gammaproteobacteria bacterium]
MWLWFHKLASPPHFYRTAGKIVPWTGWIALGLMAWGLYGGLWLAPMDYQQKDAFRIIYVHVPSAWMSMFIYVAMAVASAIALIWRMKLAHVAAASLAPVGA